MRPHPLNHKDPGVGCRWLCETAGRRTRHDEEAIAAALSELPFGGHPLPMRLVPPCPLERVK